MSTPPAAPQAPAQQQQPEAGRIQSLDARFGAIEATQAEQGGKIEQILAAVAGTAPAAPPAAQQAAQQRTERGSDAADAMRTAMTAALRDVGAEQQQASDKAELERLRAAQAHPERPPRERRSTWRARIQKGVFGITDGPPQR